MFGKKRISKVQFIALGFLIIIITGTILLMLPVSSRDGQATGFLDALFTATSASCVTGLVVVDTYSHWSLFGQIEIICMIQVGGLGFISLGVVLALMLRRRISLRHRGLMQESVNTLQIGGIVRLTKKMLIGTLIFEGIGAIILAVRFSFMMSPARAVFYGIFHSISAFCNAGFDLLGCYGEYNSLCGFEGDWTINLTISALIIIGGLGFVVWDDISRNKLAIKKYRLHSKIVLAVTAFLLVSGTALFLIFEWDNTMAGMDAHTRFLASFFSSVTPRTAGMNSVDTGALTPASKLLTMVLMFVGGSPGSTSGGAKTTTLFVIVAYLWTTMRGKYGIDVFSRRLKEDVVRKAALVIGVNMLLFITGAMVIFAVQPELGFADVIFEVISGISTVGMTTGITRSLGTVSRVVIIVLMYCGRIGSLSFALSFSENKRIVPLQQPEEEINIG